MSIHKLECGESRFNSLIEYCENINENIVKSRYNWSGNRQHINILAHFVLKLKSFHLLTKKHTLLSKESDRGSVIGSTPRHKN